MEQYRHAPRIPSWRAQGQTTCSSEHLAVCHARGSSDTELLEADIVGFIEPDTTDGVSVWIGLSWTMGELYSVLNEAICGAIGIGVLQMYRPVCFFVC
jgi:hypothetical protein